MSQHLPVAMIVAMAKNRVIGIDNRLPWHLPADLKHFKARTLGKPIIMGRKTYQSIGRPLPGRLNIVLTRSDGFSADGVSVVHSIEQALAVAAEAPVSSDQPELMVIGGEQIYRAFMAVAQRLYITEVDVEVEGDAWFPSFDAEDWAETAREPHIADGDQPAYTYLTYQRQRPNA